LGLFTLRQSTLGVTEIAQQLDLPKSNVARLVSTLEQEGYLARAEHRRYRLGLRLHDLGQMVTRSHELYAPSLEALSEVRAATGESTHLAVLNGLDVVHLDRLRSLYLVPYTGPLYRSPIHATGTGKTLLAYAPAETQEAVLASSLTAHTKNTITNPKILRKELAAIRARGYGGDIGEFVEELGCLAVPVLERSGQAAAVISVVAWNERLAEPRRTSIVALLKRVTMKIAEELRTAARS
jgi:DNA-binding IclR family transcriptional regulator